MGDRQLVPIPTFQSPVPAESPAINELLNEKFILQHGLAYHKYKIIHPIGKRHIKMNSNCEFIQNELEIVNKLFLLKILWNLARAIVLHSCTDARAVT